jgi:hypothetical protein
MSVEKSSESCTLQVSDILSGRASNSLFSYHELARSETRVLDYFGISERNAVMATGIVKWFNDGKGYQCLQLSLAVVKAIKAHILPIGPQQIKRKDSRFAATRQEFTVVAVATFSKHTISPSRIACLQFSSEAM